MVTPELRVYRRSPDLFSLTPALPENVSPSAEVEFEAQRVDNTAAAILNVHRPDSQGGVHIVPAVDDTIVMVPAKHKVRVWYYSGGHYVLVSDVEPERLEKVSRKIEEIRQLLHLDGLRIEYFALDHKLIVEEKSGEELTYDLNDSGAIKEVLESHGASINGTEGVLQELMQIREDFQGEDLLKKHLGQLPMLTTGNINRSGQAQPFQQTFFKVKDATSTSWKKYLDSQTMRKKGLLSADKQLTPAGKQFIESLRRALAVHKVIVKTYDRAIASKEVERDQRVSTARSDDDQAKLIALNKDLKQLKEEREDVENPDWFAISSVLMALHGTTTITQARYNADGTRAFRLGKEKWNDEQVEIMAKAAVFERITPEAIGLHCPLGPVQKRALHKEEADRIDVIFKCGVEDMTQAITRTQRGWRVWKKPSELSEEGTKYVERTMGMIYDLTWGRETTDSARLRKPRELRDMGTDRVVDFLVHVAIYGNQENSADRYYKESEPMQRAYATCQAYMASSVNKIGTYNEAIQALHRPDPSVMDYI